MFALSENPSLQYLIGKEQRFMQYTQINCPACIMRKVFKRCYLYNRLDLTQFRRIYLHLHKSTRDLRAYVIGQSIYIQAIANFLLHLKLRLLLIN